MKTLELGVFRISEARPADGQECWVLSVIRGYPTMQVYNQTCDCWDDAMGDDYELSIFEEDIWMPLPGNSKLEEDI